MLQAEEALIRFVGVLGGGFITGREKAGRDSWQGSSLAYKEAGNSRGSGCNALHPFLVSSRLPAP